MTARRPGPALRARRRIPGQGRARARAAVPNFFTLMNLLSGFFSLIQAAAGDLEAAAWLIVLAAAFDVFDGLVARLVGVSGEFGVELDSLSDVVSFGVAPSFLLYEFGLHQLGPLWGALLASLPALFGAVRLAKFNSAAAGGDKQPEFIGLPIPAQAGAVVVFILAFSDNAWFNVGLDVLARPQLSAVVIVVVLLSMLMVSPIRFPALPHPTPANLRMYRMRYLLFALGILLGIVFQEYGLLFAAIVYLCWGIGRALVWAVRVATGDPDVEQEDVPLVSSVTDSHS
ncbi:MAG: CDP-diacylglycerol--serine O-phosphatidyltransferase [Bacteroidota bacterium]